MTQEPELVEITLEDGRRLHVRPALAGQLRGIDLDGDLVVPLDPTTPSYHSDGSEYLIPLTPCCHAGGKGAESSTGVVCRACYHEVDSKYGGTTTTAVTVARA